MGLFQLIGRLGLDTSGFESGLKRAESATDKFTGNLVAKLGAGAAAAFAIAAVKNMVSDLHDAAIEVDHLGKRFELTHTEVQQLQKATGRLGLEFESVAGSIGRIAKARALASAGGDQGDKALGMFGQLGINSADVLNPMKSVVDIMKMIAANSSKAGRDTGFESAQFALLGKNALVLKNIMVELKELGPINLIDDENIKDAIEAMKEAKRAKAERNLAVMPIGSFVDRFMAGASDTLNSGVKEGKEMGGTTQFFSYLGALIAAPIDGLAQAINGSLSTQAPDEALVKRAADARSMKRRTSSGSSSDSGKSTAVSYGLISPGTGSLAGIGGYTFGSDANHAIVANTKFTAETLAKVQVDVSKMADVLGTEAGN